jgi:hypothetical protein
MYYKGLLMEEKQKNEMNRAGYEYMIKNFEEMEQLVKNLTNSE